MFKLMYFMHVNQYVIPTKELEIKLQQIGSMVMRADKQLTAIPRYVVKYSVFEDGSLNLVKQCIR